MKQDKFTKSARGQPCLVRVPQVCDGGGETTILAHWRQSGISGTGFKAPNIMGAHCCAPCHRAIDTGSDQFTRAELRMMHAEGIFRTQALWIETGLLLL